MHEESPPAHSDTSPASERVDDFSLVGSLSRLFWSTSQRNRRREARYDTDDQVTYVLADAPDRPNHGTLKDVSRSGLRLRTSAPIPARGLVVVKLAECDIVAEVRYCRQASEASYDVGLLIQSVTPGG